MPFPLAVNFSSIGLLPFSPTWRKCCTMLFKFIHFIQPSTIVYKTFLKVQNSSHFDQFQIQCGYDASMAYTSRQPCCIYGKAMNKQSFDCCNEIGYAKQKYTMEISGISETVNSIPYLTCPFGQSWHKKYSLQQTSTLYSEVHCGQDHLQDNGIQIHHMQQFHNCHEHERSPNINFLTSLNNLHGHFQELY